MIAKKVIPKNFISWNRRYGSPYGNAYDSCTFLNRLRWQIIKRNYHLHGGIFARLVGPFSFQSNNTTRIIEYPWAFYATDLKRGMKAIDIGGGLGGFQFVLAKNGLEVINIDPGSQEYGWNYQKSLFVKLNKAFGTNITLYQDKIENMNLKEGFYDRIFCISVLEHLSFDDGYKVVQESYKLLKKSGYLILTVDLFLDLYPFTTKKKDKWGTNIPVYELVKSINTKLVFGNISEIYGSPTFRSKRILENLPNYFIGTWPVLSQLIVLRKN